MAEWISVKDRLPENNEIVLCWRNKDGCFVGRYVTLQDTKDWYAFVAAGGRVVVGTTHWMPLPEPPVSISETNPKGE